MTEAPYELTLTPPGPAATEAAGTLTLGPIQLPTDYPNRLPLD